jgi:hypothetical protein
MMAESELAILVPTPAIYFTVSRDGEAMAVTTGHLLDLKTLKNPDGMGQK